jgi:hypothetical protein
MVADPCWSCAWSDGEPLLHLLFRWHILRAGGCRVRDGLTMSLVGCLGDVTRHGVVEAPSPVPQMLADGTASTAILTAVRKMELAMTKTDEQAQVARISQLTWLWR